METMTHMVTIMPKLLLSTRVVYNFSTGSNLLRQEQKNTSRVRSTEYFFSPSGVQRVVVQYSL